jgi:membrane fusion protein, copper/silver efflux system
VDVGHAGQGGEYMRYLIRGALGVALVLLLGLAGLGVYSLSSASSEKSAAPIAASAQVWTCSMHPQVRKDKPGNCPICGMPLIPADGNKASAGTDSPMLTLSDHARAMASVETVPVERRKLIKELRAVGKIQYNETGLATIVSRVDGYIERLYVDYTGVNVKKGDHLADIYSQELAASMSEMLIGSPYGKERYLESSKVRLRQFGMDDTQIEEVLKTGKAIPRVTLFSPIDGTVVEKMVFSGSHVDRGAILYRVANLDSVWVLLDIYESEITWIQYGREVEIRTEAYPGEVFKGIVTFISPTLHPETRTIKVRVNLPNQDRRLKPEMFVHATVRVPLVADSKPAPSGLEGKFTCPMHPEVIRSEGGKCPICGMNLEKLPGKPDGSTDAQEILAVPVSAVLDSGTRKIVYVEKARGEFSPVEIHVGPRAGDYYPVLHGLEEGQRVATRGNFLIDSQFQVAGQPSLFYPAGQAPVGGHQHGGTNTASPAVKSDPHAGHESTPPASRPEHRH